MFESITWLDLIKMFLKKWKIIAALAVVFAVVSAVYTVSFVNDTYVSRGSLYINNNNNPNFNSMIITSSDINASQQLVNTYAAILKSDRFMNIVADESGLSYDYLTLKSMINVTGDDESTMIEINVSSAEPIHSQQLAQTVLNNAEHEILRIVEGGSVKIVDDANLPTAPSSPNLLKNIIIGIFLGLILGCALAFVVETFDTSIKSETDITNKYNIPIVGIIPTLNDIEAESGYSYSSKLGGEKNENSK